MAGSVVPVLIARARARMVDRFEEAGATAPAHAIAFAPRDRRLDRRQFARMAAHGVFRETIPGHYWLDRDAWANFRSMVRRRVGGFVAIGLAAAAAAVLLG